MNTMKKVLVRLVKSFINLLKAFFGTGEKIYFNDLSVEGKRVIEMDMRDTNFLKLIRDSNAKFLGIANNKRIINLKKEINDEETSQRILDIIDYPNPNKNNADILVLSGNSYESIKDYENFFHSNYVLIKRRLYLKHYFKLILPLIKHTILWRMNFIGVIKAEQSNTKFMVFKVFGQKKKSTRKYISPIIGIEGFFNLLNEKNINYVILRWFESLPNIELGEDIDMLVDDEDAEKIETLLNDEPGLIPSDIYSVTGLPGFNYQDMAYYPPYLAREILADPILYKNNYKVPNTEKYFLSLAYHAVYHKGLKSGIESKYGSISRFKKPEHDYRSILKRIAEENKYDAEITLEGIRDYLSNNGWSPPKDTVNRLANNNKWMKEKNASRNKDHSKVGLAVFILREKALELGIQEEILDKIKKEGFTILFTKEMNEKEKDYASNRIRGGNWGPGPYNTSGGKPALIVITYDLIPPSPTKEQLARYPAIDNAHILMKSRIRNEINQSLPSYNRCNMIHSSDNYDEAIDYISIAAPEYLGRKLNNSINTLVNEFQTDHNHHVLRDMTNHGRRAKVELIRYKGGMAVKKTYTPKFTHYCQREIYVMREFVGKIDGVMDLLEFGNNYFIVPYYEDTLKFNKRESKLLPLNVSIKAINILQKFYENGYALVDFNPENIIYDKQKGIKVIDFEFIYKYQDLEKPAEFQKSFDLAGLPQNFCGEKPHLGSMQSRDYSNSWESHVGLSLDSLLYDSFLIQHVKRQIYKVRILPKRFLKKIYIIIERRYGRLLILIRAVIN